MRDVALYASWAAAKAPPSTQVVGPREPETSRQVELGAKLTLPGGKGFASAAVYQLEREDIAIPGENGVPQQTGDQRSRGLEVDLSVQARPRWVTTASYAYTDAELTRYSELVPLQPPSFVVLDRSGNTAPFAPRHIFSLWSSRHFAGGLGVGLGVRALGRQYVAEDNRYAIGRYATVDAMVSYAVRRVRLRVNLRNVTGAEHATRGFGSVSAIPGRPFEVYARAEIAFGHRASAGR